MHFSKHTIQKLRIRVHKVMAPTLSSSKCKIFTNSNAPDSDIVKRETPLQISSGFDTLGV